MIECRIGDIINLSATHLDVGWQFEGGEPPISVSVPTNAQLWASFMEYYKQYYNERRNTQSIENAATFMTQACRIMTDEKSEYKWLGDYIAREAAKQGYLLTDDPTIQGMEALWRWHVHCLFNCSQHTSWPKTANFINAGKPTAWGVDYQAVKGRRIKLPSLYKEYWATFNGWEIEQEQFVTDRTIQIIISDAITDVTAIYTL